MRISNSLYLLLTCFLCCRCGTQKNAMSLPGSLNGNYSTYQSNQGTGRGIIFRIPLSAVFLKNYTIDSFYVNARPMAFLLREVNAEKFLEADYYVLQNTAAGEGAPPEGTTVQATAPVSKRDSVLMDNRFYPSWLVVNSAGIKTRIPVTTYVLMSSTRKPE